MSETIQTNIGQEQEVIVPYGDDTLRIILSFDDYSQVWFCDLRNEGTNTDIVNGIYLRLENDALFGLGLDLGSLMLTDTDPTNTDEIDIKEDLGDRIKLVRDFNA